MLRMLGVVGLLLLAGMLVLVSRAFADVKVGEMAPAFSLRDQTGHFVTLADLVAKGPLLLAFYPGDFTPVCTQEMQSFHEDMDAFAQLGVHVVGISNDSVSRHHDFAEALHLTFPLLSDTTDTVIRAYGYRGLFGTERAYVVIDRTGRVRYASHQTIAITRRSDKELMKIIKRLDLQ